MTSTTRAPATAAKAASRPTKALANQNADLDLDLDLQQMANALITPRQSSLEMLWMVEPEAPPNLPLPQAAPQEAQVRSVGASRGTAKAAPRKRAPRRPRTSAASKKPRVSKVPVSNRQSPIVAEQAARVEPQQGPEAAREAQDTVSRSNELDNLMIAAGIAFDVVFNIETVAWNSKAKSRFYLTMLRNLVMSRLRDAISAEPPTQRIAASSITNLVFDELTKHDMLFN
jgi:hypothetical protein